MSILGKRSNRKAISFRDWDGFTTQEQKAAAKLVKFALSNEGVYFTMYLRGDNLMLEVSLPFTDSLPDITYEVKLSDLVRDVLETYDYGHRELNQMRNQLLFAGADFEKFINS